MAKRKPKKERLKDQAAARNKKKTRVKKRTTKRGATRRKSAKEPAPSEKPVQRLTPPRSVAAALHEGGPRTPPPMRILFAFDDVVERSLISSEMSGTRLAFSPVNAKNVKEAAKMLTQQRFDCALLDLHHADGDVFTLLDRLRRGKGSETPLVVLLSVDDTELVIKLLESGVEEVLFKGTLTSRSLGRGVRCAIARSKAQAARAVPPPPPPSSGTASRSESGDGFSPLQPLIGGYRIEKQIGVGGMGTVFLATQLKLKRKVALKILFPRFANNLYHMTRFTREAQALASLHHPAVIEIYDFFKDQGRFCIAMGYAPGGSLLSAIEAGGPKDERWTARAFIPVAEALWELAQHDIVHRDLKPSNLLLTEQGKLKIADFGLVKLGGGKSITRAGIRLGTPAYASPEQLEQPQHADHRSDLYCLGCTIYQTLTGIPPHAVPDRRRMQRDASQRPKPVDQLRTNLSKGIVAVVGKLMERDPAKRYQTGAEVAAALRPLR